LDEFAGREHSPPRGEEPSFISREARRAQDLAQSLERDVQGTVDRLNADRDRQGAEISALRAEIQGLVKSNSTLQSQVDRARVGHATTVADDKRALEEQVRGLIDRVRSLEADKLNLLAQLARLERGGAPGVEGALTLSAVMKDRDNLAQQLGGGRKEAKRLEECGHDIE
jgi:hypothetical protein